MQGDYSRTNIEEQEYDRSGTLGYEKLKKIPPKLYSNRENCCGCSACYAICPVGAIMMLPDDEGFLYPTVDEEKCVKCYRCLSVCAFKVDQEAKGYLNCE